MSEPFPEGIPHVDGVRHYYASAGGLRVHVAEAGPEDGDPVLLLHGWPQHWYLWRGLVPILSPHYRMLMPDLRGLGWTDAPPSSYDKETLARDQIALLDALGIDRVKLIAHDWGGYAAFLMCLLHPERVERYLATNINHPWPKPSARGLLNIWRLSYQLPMVLPWIGPRVTRRRGFIKFMLNGSRRGVFTPEEVEAFEAPYRDPARSFVTARIYRSFLAHDLPLLLKRHWERYRLTVPTRMVIGLGDPVVTPQSLTGWEPHADDLEIEFVPDSGHFVVDAHPQLVGQRALEFFGAR